jgi:uncharacterized protein
MNAFTSCLYHGEVVHRRLAPVRHELRYRVYNLFADIDELPALGKSLRLFSYNRFNLFSIDDRKFGPGDGTPIREHVWSLVGKSAAGKGVTKIFMFCYPSVLGHVFNPLTVFYGFNSAGCLQLMIYEVNNTFGERHTYVIPVGATAEQSCNKKFYVSPFNRVEGHYDFNVQAPGEKLKLAIGLTNSEGPCLNAWFTGAKTPLTDRSLLKSFLSLPLLPLKVVAGIHWEAAKLMLKGMRLQQRPPPLDPPVSISKTAQE